MDAYRGAATSAKTEDGTAQQRPPPNCEWNYLGVAKRRAVAGLARAVWEGGNGEQSVLSVGGSGRMGTGAGSAPSRSRSGGAGGLGDAPSGQQHRACPSTRGRGKKSDADSEAIGRSRGGLTTKIHVRVDGKGQPITFHLTPGQRGDVTQAQTLLESGIIHRTTPGRPRQRPRRIVADKAYSSRAFRAFLRRRGIRVTIPRPVCQPRRGKFDKAIYRQRNHVERFFSRLKQFRRIATRYEKRAVNYHAMLTIAAILLWL
jgi:transposase